ncbi:hypothetical protein [Streptomyces sp. NPDC020681]|uniref:hypothetical protein n=1 Tax=Streptomyces sp. NPDC020681 TaxID=3365083 RepID=UPI0037AE2790
MTTLPTTVRRRRPMRTAAAVCALAVLPATAALGTSNASAAAPKPDAVVTMGDSFISGEGARWLGNAEGLKNFGGIPQALRDTTDRVKTDGIALDKIYDADCRRSDVAAIGGGAKKYNIACSGAATAQLSRATKGRVSQLQQLRTLAKENNIKAVVLSVGGSDLKLTDTMKACAEAWKNNRYCSTDVAFTSPVTKRMRTVSAKVERAVNEITEVFRAAGSTPRVIVQSYPMPLASGAAATTAAHDENGWDRWSAYGCPFYNRDLSWIDRTLGTGLNTELKKAADKTGADFVDLSRLLEGHQVCGKARQTGFASDGRSIYGPSAAKAEWARYLPRTKAALPAAEAQELLHPNYYGQQALGRCLTLVMSKLAMTAAGSDAQCRATAGRSPRAVTVSYTS